jgi:4-hydroxybutyrate CoA-transferase
MAPVTLPVDPGWRAVYQRRTVDAATAASKVPAGSLIVFSSYEGEPTVLIDALLASGVLASCRGVQSVRGTRGLLADPGLTNGFRLITYAPHGRVVDAVANGSADFIPSSIHTFCRFLEEGIFAPDVAVVNLSPPDEDGFCSFGTSTDFAALAAKRARLVIAQANAGMPRIPSETRIHVSEIDWFVPADIVPAGAARVAVDDVSARIGAHVADLIPNGACIEVGIGAIPDASLAALHSHTGLGAHSGLLTDGIMDLYRAGGLTGENKEADRGLIVANQINGSHELYEFARTCPAVSMRAASYTHDARVIGSISRFIALNSALQVDLRGQINSEWLRGRQVAGTGGSLDFAMGAALSPGGRCIVALPSTSRDGKHSRIVPELAAGTVVTIPDVLVDYVVTEYGVASLRGKPLAERRRELAAVAHPAFRRDIDTG